MTTTTLTRIIIIKAAPETVFRAMTDWSRQNEWMVGTTVTAGQHDGQGVAATIAARTALGSAISHPYVTPDERLHVMTLDPAFEQRLLEAVRQSEGGQVLALDAGTVDALVNGCSGLLTDAERLGLAPVLVCSPQVRAALSRLMRQILPRLPVISYTEVSRTAQIESLGVVHGAVAVR